MKAKFTRLVSWLMTIFLCTGAVQTASAQGRVIINEYMPWPGNACGTPSEFVELLNMGPGPVDIGCYILTDGDYSVTIPPGTILAPGQFFVMAGQNVLPMPCTNINMNVNTDLNWNTCNCTSAPIPSLGGGFLTDGGSANEQVVLLSPSLQVVDAVARSLPVESSSTITTSGSVGCAPQTFDLDLMSIQYEIIGESAGRGNSFARLVDGACDWVKDTQQSGGGTNNTPGDAYALSYSLYVTEDINCTGGNVFFTLQNSPASSYFPLDYILGYDADKDGQFTSNDYYTTGIDNSEPTLDIFNLPLGLYAINIGPVQGCDYRNFTFLVGPCAPLNVTLRHFTALQRNGETILEASISGCQELGSVELESSRDGKTFEWVASLPLEAGKPDQVLQYALGASPANYYRINMINQRRVSKFSPVLSLNKSQHSTNSLQISPNPFRNEFQLRYERQNAGRIRISVLAADGRMVAGRETDVQRGLNFLPVNSASLPKGLYLVKVLDMHNGEIQTFKAIKE